MNHMPAKGASRAAAFTWRRTPLHRSIRNQGEREVTVKNLIGRFVREEDGQDIIEYALLAAFVSIVAATIIETIGSDVKTIYTNVKVQTAAAAAASGGAGGGS